VIHYRSFRNPDPPVVADVWNASLSGPRTAVIPVQATTILEYFTLSKPYFDPRGLILAFDDNKPVGFVHAGFGPSPDGKGLDTSIGIVCTLGVIPSHRRQGIGSELLRQVEAYLRGRGANEILAGPVALRNPFTFGLYGGSNSAGFLASDTLARPFLEKHGYQVIRTSAFHQRRLQNLRIPADPRFQTLRQQYDIIAAPHHGAGWYREAVLGPVEVVEYRLQDKKTSEVTAKALLWVMELFSHGWQEACVGMLGLEVQPAHRRRGHAKYLLGQTLRHLREQPFDLFEAVIEQDNSAGLGLLRQLEFEQVEVAHGFRRA